MPRPLASMVLSYLRDKEGFRTSLKHPVLVWQGAPPEGTDEGGQGTDPGVDAGTGPRGGEALVFDVAKDPAKKNAFTMWITVGRNDNNDIALDDGSVSRFHASIQFEGGALVLRDAESKNGTFCDDRRIEREQKVAISDRSRLRFGGVEVLFLSAPSAFAMVEQLMDAEQAPSSSRATAEVQPPRASPRIGHDRPTLEVAAPPREPPAGGKTPR